MTNENKYIATPPHKWFWRDWTTLEKTQAVFDFFLVVFTGGLLRTSCNQWDVAKSAVAGPNKAFVYAKKKSKFENLQNRQLFPWMTKCH
jgi:hypothetical protein